MHDIRNVMEIGSIKITILRAAAIIGAVLLFVGGPDHYSPRSLKALWDLGHIVFFYVLSTLILLAWPRDKKIGLLRQFAALMLISLILSISIELAQAGLHRTADVMDAGRNLVGSLVAFAFTARPNKTTPTSYLRSTQALSILLVIFAIVPLVKAAADEWTARQQFPVLSDLETPFEIDRWSGDAALSIDHAVHSQGKSSLRVTLNPSLYSGVKLRYFPGNWRHYNFLYFSVFNPLEEPITITCRIHDRLHAESSQAYDDRFNESFLVSKGWHHIKISLDKVARSPKKRKLDLGQIEEIGIFAMRLPAQTTIYIDNVFLSKRSPP